MEQLTVGRVARAPTPRRGRSPGAVGRIGRAPGSLRNTEDTREGSPGHGYPHSGFCERQRSSIVPSDVTETTPHQMGRSRSAQPACPDCLRTMLSYAQCFGQVPLAAVAHPSVMPPAFINDASRGKAGGKPEGRAAVARGTKPKPPDISEHCARSVGARWLGGARF